MSSTDRRTSTDRDRHASTGEYLLDGGETRRVGTPEAAQVVSLEGLGRPGETLGRYVLLRPLGAGGMSVVWLAYDPELDRRVALKLMHAGSEHSSFGAGDQRLLREAQALARLSHVNVVHVYDVGALDGQVYIAMELVEGVTLREWLGERTHPWRETLALLIRAGRGLAAAHAAGLVHLDFKPSNVLVGADPQGASVEREVRVVDFGLAREPTDVEPRASDESMLTRSGRLLGDRLTEDGAVLGTPGYIAPELLCGRPADARADQFSFCVTAWEALFGERPFAGEEYAELHRNLLAGRLRDAPAASTVPRSVRRALQRGLAVSPSQRFAAMTELLAAIEPRSRARPLLWAAGGAAVASALVLPLLQPDAQRSDPCAEIVEQLATSWNPQRAEQARVAFERTATPFAAAAWHSASRLLGSYAERWSNDARDACEATMVRVEQSQEVYELRRACYDDALAQLEAVMEVFVAADATVVEHAVQAVLGIPSPGHCGDLEALRAEASEPRDPVVREAAAAIDHELARVRVAMDAGRMAEAVSASATILARARELDHPPTSARALLVAANARAAAGEGQQAVALLDEALWTAERSGLDRLRLRILVDEVYLVGHLLRDTSRGRWYAGLADAVQQRIGGGERLAWQLVIHRGVLAADAGEHGEALALFERALAASEADGNDDGNRPTLLMNIGSAHYERGDHRRALEFYQRALDLEVEQLGESHPAIATALENRANAEQALGQLDAALADHTRALRIHERLGLLAGSEHAMLLNNVGVVLSGMRRWDEAIVYYQRASALLEPAEREHPLAAIAVINIAEARLAQGRAAEALALYRGAHERLAAALGPDHPYVAAASTGIGLAHLELGEYEAARANLEHALVVHREGGDPLQLAETRFGLARVMIASGDEPAPARRLAEQAREGLLVTGPRGAPALARIDRFLAER